MIIEDRFRFARLKIMVDACPEYMRVRSRTGGTCISNNFHSIARGKQSVREIKLSHAPQSAMQNNPKSR